MNDINYISAEGLQKLKDELAYRKSELRKEISEAIGVAKEQGDLSENFVPSGQSFDVTYNSFIALKSLVFYLTKTIVPLFCRYI